MPEGTPSGSPPSPVLCLLFIANILDRVDTAIVDFFIQASRSSWRLQTQDSFHRPYIQVDFMRYADDLNPIVAIKGTSNNKHSLICNVVYKWLEEAAQEENRCWNPHKETCITYSDEPPQFTSILGITINSTFSL